MEYITSDLIIFVIRILLIVSFVVFSLIGQYEMYNKAGKPGWAVIVPFYNVYVLLKIVNKPGWWLLLYLIPLANIVVSFIVALELAKVFGRSPLFGIVLNFLFAIGPIIIGLGSSQYKGNSSTPPSQAPIADTLNPAQPSTPSVS